MTVDPGLKSAKTVHDTKLLQEKYVAERQAVKDTLPMPMPMPTSYSYTSHYIPYIPLRPPPLQVNGRNLVHFSMGVWKDEGALNVLRRVGTEDIIARLQQEAQLVNGVRLMMKTAMKEVRPIITSESVDLGSILKERPFLIFYTQKARSVEAGWHHMSIKSLLVHGPALGVPNSILGKLKQKYPAIINEAQIAELLEEKE